MFSMPIWMIEEAMLLISEIDIDHGLIKKLKYQAYFI